jgi:hypothetical protein
MHFFLCLYFRRRRRFTVRTKCLHALTYQLYRTHFVLHTRNRKFVGATSFHLMCDQFVYSLYACSFTLLCS